MWYIVWMMYLIYKLIVNLKVFSYNYDVYDKNIYESDKLM